MLVVASLRTRRLLRLLARSPKRNLWTVLYGLISGFTLAYFAAAALLYLGETERFIELLSLILLLGTVFVLVVVYSGYHTIDELQRGSAELEQDLMGSETTLTQLRVSETAAAEANARMAELYVELEEMHEQAVAATQAKTDFLARMSHELRTPLNAVIGFAQLLKRGDGTPEDDAQKLDIILRSGNHLLQLINDILDISKIEAGQMTLEEEAFDAQELARTTAALLQPRAAEKQLEFEVAVADGTPTWVRGDRRKLKQVLINLINNALKFTARGGVYVRVSGGPEGDGIRLRFEVRDTGPGIAAQELETLFAPFTQTEAGKQAKTGSGLGLAISSEFVRLMGGELAVESELGVGTRFMFDAQLKPGGVIAANKKTRGIVRLRPGHPERRVLIADDQPVNRLLLKLLLEPLGFAVREAVDGVEAVAVTREWSPHVVLMDVQMPGLDGYDATRQIKAELAEPPAILAVTAGVFSEERARCEEAGCDELLSKPLEANKLLETLARHVEITWEYDTERAQAATG